MTPLDFEEGQEPALLAQAAQLVQFGEMEVRLGDAVGRGEARAGVLVLVDFAPHALEFLRDEHAHRRLGFSDAEVAEWCRAAGLDPASPRHLPGDPLTVVIWTAHRHAPTHPRFAQALQPGAPALVEGELH